MAQLHAPTLASETVGHLMGLEIRNTLIMAWLAMGFLIAVAILGRRTGWKLVPGRLQVSLELVVGGLFDFCDSIVQNREKTRTFFPLVATIFLFLITGNWMGILPGVGSLTITGTHEGNLTSIPIFRSMNADVNMTLTVAVISVLASQIYGIVALGPFHYGGKFIKAPWRDPIGAFVGLLEMVAECAKIISFSFRLFGNIFAGEVLLVVISFLVPYVAPLPFLGLEIFVGFIQALVFAMLTLVFLKMAVTAH